MKKKPLGPWGKTILLYLSIYVINFIKGVFHVPIKRLESAVSTSALGRSVAPYLSYLATWAVYLLVFLVLRIVTKGRNNQFAMLSPSRKGNTPKLLLVGLGIGFGGNLLCARAAIVHGDISLSLQSVQPIAFAVLFVAIFIQSAAEELIVRGYLLENIRHFHKSPLPAMIVSSLAFVVMHMALPGLVPVWMPLTFFGWGLLTSLLVLYTDSLWIAFGFHAAWNFTQAILLGLSNTGIVTEITLFGLTQAPTDSLMYSSMWGVEAALPSVLFLFASALLVYLVFRKRAVTA